MIIVNLYLRNKVYRPIKLKYRLAYNTITLLCSAYIYYKYKSKVFSYTGLFLFCGYFSPKSSRRYFDWLVNCNMITLAGKRKYTLTDTGLAVIHEIEDSYTNVVYQFCNKHNISL
jgi:hypothetical protein